MRFKLNVKNIMIEFVVNQHLFQYITMFPWIQVMITKNKNNEKMNMIINGILKYYMTKITHSFNDDNTCELIANYE